jgi:hypothetical protein
VHELVFNKVNVTTCTVQRWKKSSWFFFTPLKHMQILDAYNNILLYTLYTKFLTYCFFYPYISVWCTCVYIYIHTIFKSVCSNISRYIQIIIFISHCGVSSKLTLSVYSSRNVNTKQSTFLNTKLSPTNNFPASRKWRRFCPAKENLFITSQETWFL